MLKMVLARHKMVLDGGKMVLDGGKMVLATISPLECFIVVFMLLLILYHSLLICVYGYFGMSVKVITEFYGSKIASS
jgi:hypothetical protein